MGTSLNLSQSYLNSTSNQSLDDSGKQTHEDSLNLPPVLSNEDANKSSCNVVDESFSALLSKKKSVNVNKQTPDKETTQVQNREESSL